jgi:hypothetical protein
MLFGGVSIAKAMGARELRPSIVVRPSPPRFGGLQPLQAKSAVSAIPNRRAPARDFLTSHTIEVTGLAQGSLGATRLYQLAPYRDRHEFTHRLRLACLRLGLDCIVSGMLPRYFLFVYC